MKKVFVWVNFILTALVLGGAVLYIAKGGLLTKGITSIGFVLIGVLNLLYALKNQRDFNFPIVMLAGLFLCMLGDIAINLNFIVGAVIFAAGHVFYFAAYCLRTGFRGLSAIFGGVILAFSASILLFVPVFKFDMLTRTVCLIYAIIISFMLGNALNGYVKEKNPQSLLIAVGSALFYFSDLMLVFDKFADVPHIMGILCIASYYPAQCLLTYSVYFSAKNKIK